MLDLISSGLNYVAFSFTAGSIVIMLNISSIVWTSIFSYFFLKKILYRHHFLGIGLIFIGVILLGLGSNDSKNTTWLGFFL